MCNVVTKEPLFLGSSLSLFKLVRGYGSAFKSLVEPGYRSDIMDAAGDWMFSKEAPWSAHWGSSVIYELDQEAVAPEPPGLMAYLSLEQAVAHLNNRYFNNGRLNNGYHVLRCDVERDTAYRLGHFLGQPLICVAKLTPREVVS